MRTTFILIALAMCSSVGFSSTIYVPDDYPTIQQAIVAANPGDTVLVRPGTYHEAIDFLGKAITVTGEHGAANTTIDGSTFQGFIVTCQSGEGPDSILDGFTIANGTGTGMLNSKSSPTVTNCIFAQNGGSGLYCYCSNLMVSDCSFIQNIKGGMTIISEPYKNSRNVVTLLDCAFVENTNDEGEGGGIDQSYGVLTATNCVFIQNSTTGSGGGIRAGAYLYGGYLALTDCVFQGNSAQCSGGGLHTSDNMAVTNCTFIGNEAITGRGGGMCVSNYYFSVINSTLNNNVAVEGGGIYLYGEEGSTQEIANSLFSENSAERGGGVFIFHTYDVGLSNITLFGNSASEHGGGIAQHTGSTVMANMIFWSNSAPRGPEMDLTLGTYGAALNISCSDVMGGQSSVYVEPGATLNWGAGMIDADPLFVDQINGDFHLQQDPCQPGVVNPCVDAGDPSSPMFAGSTRTDNFQDTGVLDMGYHYAIDDEDDILHVPSEYPTIQLAIEGAEDKETVMVAPGT